MLTENDRKNHFRQAEMQWQTGQVEVFKKALGKMKENHPNYRKDYMKEWNMNHPNYMKEWNRNNPNYMKEWKSRNKEKQKHYMKDYMRKWNEKHPNNAKDRAKE